MNKKQYLVTSHTLTDDFGVFIDPDVWSGAGAEKLGNNFRQHFFVKYLINNI
jgi:hypothetical protein